MSSEEGNDNEKQETKPIDPLAPTRLDPKLAFQMAAATPGIEATGHWSPPAAEVLDPLFPDHEILELIGRGGMGAVYKGLQKSLDRHVAIKLLPPEIAAADPTFAARFENEAKAMAQLDHPNIVTVFDFGQTEAGHYYIIMEFVDGMDFHQLIRANQLDTQGALNAVSQICDALEYAHGKGYVHRDIKPANIFINQQGILKVGDFGLAKMLQSEDDAEQRPSFTQTGFSMGTPEYCAPEQIKGGNIDHRVDIYSLGVMFYEMLTHELPRGNFPPPSKKVQVDIRLDEVVLKAMESSPEMRYSSAGEMRTDVDVVRSGSVEKPALKRDGGDDTDKKNKSKGKSGLVIWLVVGIALLGVAGWAINKPNHSETKSTESASQPTSDKTSFSKHGVYPLKPPFPPSRLVMLPLDDRSTAPIFADELAELDPDEIVDFKVNGYSLYLLQAEGAVRTFAFTEGSVIHQRMQEDFKTRSPDTRWINISPGLRNQGVWALRDDGILTLIYSPRGFGHPEGTRKGPYRSVSINPIFGLGVRPDGSVESWGDVATKFDAELKQISNTLEISASSQYSLIALMEDGRAILRAKNSALNLDWEAHTVEKICENSDVILNNGTVSSLQGSFDTPSKLRDGTHRWRNIWRSEIDPTTKAIAAVDTTGKTHVWVKKEELEYSEKLSVALKDAIAVKFRWKDDGNCILALLPPESIPRSGYWEVDDLIAAREKIRRENEELSISQPKPASKEPQPTLPLPELPLQRPKEKCRLIILPVFSDSPRISSALPWIDSMASSDFPDIVRLCDTNPQVGGILGLRSTGELVAWGNQELVKSAHDFLRTDTVSFFRLANRIFAQSQAGDISPINHEAISWFPKKKVPQFVQLQSFGGSGVGIQPNGALKVLGPDDFSYDFESVEKKAVQIIGGENGMSILFNDGDWRWYHKGKKDSTVNEMKVTSECDLLLSRTYGRIREGRIVAGATPRYYIEWLKTLNQLGGKKVIRLDQSKGAGWDETAHYGIVEMEGNQWAVYQRNEGDWRDLGIGKALEGANQVLFIDDEDHQRLDYLVALFPADSVPHSGFWEVDDLIKARKEMRTSQKQ